MRRELEELGAPMGLPRNKAGFYIREGVEWLKERGHGVKREGRTYSLA
jgi:hypothetical protein